MPRLVRAALSGDYTGITKGRLALMAAAVAYIVSPIDLIPEFVFLAGLAEVALGMGWLAPQVAEATEALRACALAPVAPAYATASGYSVPSDTPFDTRFDTVRGNVVS